MSVLLETSIGDIIIDLHTNDCPIASKNFLQLCKTSYYQNSLVHIIKKNASFQTGFCTVKTPFDTSIYGILYGMQNNYFDPLSLLTLRISDRIRTKLVIIPIIPNASIKINHQL